MALTRTLVLWALAGTSGAFGLSLSRPVAAFTCSTAQLLAPAPDVTSVPTNTRIWCGHPDEYDALPFSVTDADGTQVSGTSHTIATVEFDVIVFAPEEELLQETTYFVTCLWGTYSFTTGVGPTEGPPDVPDLATWSTRARQGSGWGDEFSVLFEGVGDEGTLVVVDLDGSATLNPEDPSGSVTQITGLGALPNVYVGSNPCGGTWREASFGTTASFTLGAFDLAGHFSGWSESLQVTLPETYTEPEEDLEVGTPAPSKPPASAGQGRNRVSCQFAGGNAPMPLWALAGLLVHRARRRRSPSPSVADLNRDSLQRGRGVRAPRQP